VDADELGWAETYDAEYIALAQVQKSTLVILDKSWRGGQGVRADGDCRSTDL
jgi:hypothetical protein